MNKKREKKENFIFNLIQKEKKRQIRNINLIASENFVSKNILKSLSSVLTNKYAEGYPNNRYYSGCKIIDKIEQTAIDIAKKLFKVSYVNVQPHSGSQANAAVYMACLNPGDKILSLELSHGGHLTHGSKVNFSGILYETIHYNLDIKTGLIDYNKIMDIAKKNKPKLIICGASSYSRDIEYKLFREISDKVNAILMADISHTVGLIIKGLLNNPFLYCHIVTSTTHKTLRGPRGGIILIKNDFEIKNNKGKIFTMSNIINNAVFPGIQGGPSQNIIAAKAICFQEAMTEEYNKYVKQIISNSKYLSQLLINKGYNIISGGTDNHCMLINLKKQKINGKIASETLEMVGINCNKNMIPYDRESPYITSGIRIGTPAITTRGFKEKDMAKIAYWIDKALKNKDNFLKLKNIKLEINNIMKDYPLFSWK